MHTLHFDPATERQLDRLSGQTGRQVEQIIEQAVLDFLGRLPADTDAANEHGAETAGKDAAWCAQLREWVQAQPLQIESAGAFMRHLRDTERY